MKIGLLTFPIGKVGGILTNVKNLEKGLLDLGHTVEKYFITTNIRKKPEKNDFGWECLGFESEEFFKEYLDKVNDLDLVIWEVCCPHKTKAYTRETWKKCFNVKPQQLAYIHDNYFEKYYPWYAEIPLKHNIKIICPYQYMFDGARGLRAMKEIIDNPISIPNSGLYTESKKDILVDHNNWKGIKHKELVMKYVDQYDGNVIMFGDKNTLEYRQAVQEFDFTKVDDRGWCDREEIDKALQSAKVVTDLCKRGNVSNIYDYTITEAIAFGCIPVLQTKICPKHADIFVEYIHSPHQLPSVVNRIMSTFDDYEDRRISNLKFIDRLIPKNIASEICEYSTVNYKETTVGTLFSF